MTHFESNLSSYYSYYVIVSAHVNIRTAAVGTLVGCQVNKACSPFNSSLQTKMMSYTAQTMNQQLRIGRIANRAQRAFII